MVQELWVAEVRENLAPKVLKAHLLGDTKALKPWLSEGVYSKLAADIRTRKHDGISFDTNILNFDETQVLMKFTDSGAPAVIITYMVQQIHCVRNRKGEIIEVMRSQLRMASFRSAIFECAVRHALLVVDWLHTHAQFQHAMIPTIVLFYILFIVTGTTCLLDK